MYITLGLSKLLVIVDPCTQSTTGIWGRLPRSQISRDTTGRKSQNYLWKFVTEEIPITVSRQAPDKEARSDGIDATKCTETESSEELEVCSLLVMWFCY